MVVLLIGGGSVMMNAVIDKLNKNGHRVYLLTGRKDKKFTYRHVFEKFYFLYDSGSLKDIFESIKPEVTLFMGAYDTNFDWGEARQESVRYIGGLMNILAALSMVKAGRFVYLSSQEVYGVAYVDDIKEEEPSSPVGFKALALAQGEEICANYRKNQELDTMVLRLDHVYWVPEKGGVETDPCFQMCREALRTGKISANRRHAFSLLYLNDALEMAYKVIFGTSRKYDCYHISSMEQVGEMELAEKIRDVLDAGVEVVDSTVGMNSRLVLDGNRYKEEHPTEIFMNWEKGVERVVTFMKRHSGSFVMEEDTGAGLGGKVWNSTRRICKALFPYIENLILFFPFYLLHCSAAESAFFARLDFLLLYVLLFAAIHGQGQAVFSGLLAVAGYCAWQMKERTGFEVLLDYNTYVWMAQLFIVGLVVGYLKDQLHFLKGESSARIQYLEGQLRDIEDINDSNVRMKHNFEAQVVNQKESLGKIYEITSSLEQYGPEEVLFYAAQVLSKLMDSQDVAVYTVANGDYARLFSATSREARKLGNSIRYTDDSMAELYGELKEHRVYVNRNMTDNLPMMASAVYSEDNMQLILMLWGIPWERMTLGESNRLTIVGYLIQNAVVRANHYLEALRNQRYVEGTKVLDEEAFTQLAKAFLDARDKGLTEYVLLEVQAGESNYEQVASTLGSAIRQTDYLGILKGNRLYALLTNTGRDNVGGVIERFQKAGYACVIDEEAIL